MIASLPMYALPGMQHANAAFWQCLSAELAQMGIDDAPACLTPAENALPVRLREETFFSQMCGYPLHYMYQGQYKMLGTPLYDLPGCGIGPDGVPVHRSFIVVARRSSFESLLSLRASRFALNGYDSNSGMNLPRLLFAAVANGQAFFSDMLVTGSHLASMAAVASGIADAASIDCVTFGLCARYHPELVCNLRVLAETASCPAIPFITAAATPAPKIAALTAALTAPDARKAAYAGLCLAKILPPVPASYAAVREIADRAAAMGYATLQ